MRKSSEEKMYEILEYVTSEAKKNGYPPTVREICKAVDLNSPSTVHAYLTKLEEKDLIRKESLKTRAIQVNRGNSLNYDPTLLPMREMIEIPVVGHVAAGQPILAQENIVETFPVPVDFLNGADGFMLRVKGDSMIELVY